MVRRQRAAKQRTKARTRATAAADAPLARDHASASSWRPNKTTAPVAFVVEEIADRIRSGRLVAGQRLIEADLCTELSVKRGPVREALRILAGDGVLELVAQRGARVRKLSVADLKEMMPVLAGLVAVAIRLSIGRLRQASIRGELERHMEQMRYSASTQDLGQFQLAGMRYHETLQRAANNRVLNYLRAKLHPDLLHQQIPAGMRVDNWKSYLRHFEQVHSALLSGDERRAVELVYEHQAELDSMFQTGEQPPRWE